MHSLLHVISGANRPSQTRYSVLAESLRRNQGEATSLDGYVDASTRLAIVSVSTTHRRSTWERFGLAHNIATQGAIPSSYQPAYSLRRSIYGRSEAQIRRLAEQSTEVLREECRTRRPHYQTVIHETSCRLPCRRMCLTHAFHRHRGESSIAQPSVSIGFSTMGILKIPA